VPLFETVVDLRTDAERLRRRPYGVIEAADGRFVQVRLRPLPKIASAPKVLLLGGIRHRFRSGDRCWLYYDQPRRFPGFLALKYLVSNRATTWATICRALEALDEIARLKQTDALLCDLANWRISEKMAARWGWVPHCPSRWHRHYIRRFYGQYPPAAAWLRDAARCEHPEPAIPR
jgi:hypothetical protein